MEHRIDELKRYVRFSERDAERLALFKATAEPHFQRIAGEFYDRIREHEDAQAVLRDEGQIKRLQASLVRWQGRLLSGRYDEEYFDETSKIGRMHVRVGLPQRYMFTAMALIRVSLVELAAGDASLVSAICRLLDVELAIMMEAYNEEWGARLAKARAFDSAHHPYKNVAELFPAVMIAADREGLVRTFNAEAEVQSGYSREDVIGQSFARTIFGEEPEIEHVATVAAVMGGSRKTARVDAPMRTRSGNERMMRWQLSHVPAQGEVHDIVLFAMGSDFTDDLAAQHRSKQQEKLAAVGLLAAGLAHEIRNPLNGAQLHVAFLERALRGTSATGEMIDAVHVVRDEIKRLANLVTEFLEFARPRSLRLGPVSVSALCKRVEELAMADAKTANVVLECDLPQTDVVLEADREKLEQVLLNLVRNAIEALAPQGGGHTTLRARKQPRAVRVEVEDDGPGLPPDGAPVFDAFYSTKPHGTGLGLAIALRIVSDHGGTLGVSSAPGKTVFTVTVPWSPIEVKEKGPS